MKTNQTILSKKNLLLIVASSWTLAACGSYGAGQGGDLASVGNGITNQFEEIGSVDLADDGESLGDATSDPNVPIQLAAPVTEAEAFTKVDASHTPNIRGVATFISAAAGSGLDELTSTGPQTASTDAYGGVAPPVVSPVDPVANPPTGVDNPDTLPTPTSSSSKKDSIAAATIAELEKNRGAVVQIPADVVALIKSEILEHLKGLHEMNMTNLSAETQNLVNSRIVVLEKLASIL